MLWCKDFWHSKKGKRVYLNWECSFQKKNQGALNKADFYDKVWCYSNWILMIALVKEKEKI